jgi:PEP-CTERM motif
VHFRFITFCLAIISSTVAQQPLRANTTLFGLLGDPGHNYTFTRSDSPGGQVTDPVAPYPGWLGANVAGDQYGFFCIDYLKGATWNTSYSGSLYHVTDAIPGKTQEQLVEAAYLSSTLNSMGGLQADTTLYQGPISFAVWQIMDPTPGDVPVSPAAQAYVQQAQHLYQLGQITAALYPNTLIFVPDNTGIQDFMTLTAAVPEPGTVALFAIGLGLICLGSIRVGRLKRDACRYPPKNVAPRSST